MSIKGSPRWISDGNSAEWRCLKATATLSGRSIFIVQGTTTSKVENESDVPFT